MVCAYNIGLRWFGIYAWNTKSPLFLYLQSHQTWSTEPPPFLNTDTQYFCYSKQFCYHLCEFFKLYLNCFQRSYRTVSVCFWTTRGCSIWKRVNRNNSGHVPYSYDRFSGPDSRSGFKHTFVVNHWQSRHSPFHENRQGVIYCSCLLDSGNLFESPDSNLVYGFLQEPRLWYHGSLCDRKIKSSINNQISINIWLWSNLGNVKYGSYKYVKEFEDAFVCQNV